jgi:hypothetical protein
MYSTTTDDRLKIVVEVERRDQTLVARIEDNGSASIRPRLRRRPLRLRSRRQRSAISVSI